MMESQETILARIDERTKALIKDVADIKQTLQNKYVTQDEFQPIKKAVYGFIAVVLVLVITAFVALIIKK